LVVSLTKEKEDKIVGRVKVRANRKVKISYVIYHETFQKKSEKRKEKKR
jgi:hypothetical protein